MKLNTDEYKFNYVDPYIYLIQRVVAPQNISLIQRVVTPQIKFATHKHLPCFKFILITIDLNTFNIWW
jgi:hypothetical protein